jgi:hypothetical protein
MIEEADIMFHSKPINSRTNDGMSEDYSDSENEEFARPTIGGSKALLYSPSDI